MLQCDWRLCVALYDIQLEPAIALRIEGDDVMKKQPELPDLVRDMEIVQSLNRTLTSVTRDAANGHELKDAPDVSDGSTT
ncbi:hypothetical protein ALPO108162_12305 [Alicyclobacillus pomorum]